MAEHEQKLTDEEIEKVADYVFGGPVSLETVLDSDECPRCAHDADAHDENGCTICGCPGP